MTNLLLPFLFITQALAITFENDPAAIREPYPMLTLEEEGVYATDPVGDLVVHDRRDQQIVPPLLADMTEFAVRQSEKGYIAHFTIAAPLPDDPEVPMNFFVYINSDGNKSTNAPATMSGPGSDAVVMLLFGTRTKWHSQWWQFDAGQQQWNRQENKPTFTVAGSVFTLQIPEELQLYPGRTTLRGFALTSDNAGSTAQDVVPGEGLPPVALPEAKSKQYQTTFSPMHITIAAILACTAGMAGGMFLWRALR